MSTHALTVRSFTHNVAAQLTQVTERNMPAAAQTFSYDARGNQSNGGAVSFNYASQLTARSTAGYTASYTDFGKLGMMGVLWTLDV